MINQLAKQFIKTSDTNPLVLKITDFTQISGGFFVGSSVRVATTTTPNDSLIMPANHYKIIKALKRIGEYSKYYTDDSTPKTVLIENVSQCSRIQSAPSCSGLTVGETYNVKKNSIIHNGVTYGVGSSFVAVNTLWVGVGMVVKGLDNASFFNSNSQTNFHLFDNTQNEAKCQVLYPAVFDYFPITQDSDSINLYLGASLGGAIHVDWDDGTANDYTLIWPQVNVIHTYATRLGLTKNIKVTGAYGNIRNIMVYTNAACTMYISNLTHLSQLQTANTVLSSVTGEIKVATMLEFEVLRSSANDLSTYSVVLPTISRWTAVSVPAPSMVNISGGFGNFVFLSNTISVYNKLVTYNGGTLPAINANLNIKCGWNSSMVDSFLNTFAAAAPTAVKTLDLRGNNQGRSSASDAAISTLTTKTWSVLTSNGWIFRGDSITRGSQASDSAHRWTSLFCAAKGKTELNHGTDGQALMRATGYQSTIENEYPYYTGNKIFINYGVNDAFQNWATSEFSANLEYIIQYLINTKGWPVSEIKLLSCTYVTNATIISRVPNYNTVIQNLATQYGIQYCDLYTYMLNNGGAAILADGTHPNDAGYQVIADYMIANIA